MRGKRGELTRTFVVAKDASRFPTLFLKRGSDPRLRLGRLESE
jgi:hypothetical protein